MLRITEGLNHKEYEEDLPHPLRKMRKLRSHDFHKQSQMLLTCLELHIPLLPLKKLLSSLPKCSLTLLLLCHPSLPSDSFPPAKPLLIPPAYGSLSFLGITLAIILSISCIHRLSPGIFTVDT